MAWTQYGSTNLYTNLIESVSASDLPPNSVAAVFAGIDYNPDAVTAFYVVEVLEVPNEFALAAAFQYSAPALHRPFLFPVNSDQPVANYKLYLAAELASGKTVGDIGASVETSITTHVYNAVEYAVYAGSTKKAGTLDIGSGLTALSRIVALASSQYPVAAVIAGKQIPGTGSQLPDDTLSKWLIDTQNGAAASATITRRIEAVGNMELQMTGTPTDSDYMLVLRFR